MNLGFLREILEEACEESGRSMKELTVLKGYRDPYRFDTPKNHALGVGFKQPVGRFVPEDEEAEPWLIRNEPIELEIDGSLMPSFYARFQPRQRYRIILITEKSSLRPILQPIAKDIAAELLAMTGESSPSTTTRSRNDAARPSDGGARRRMPS
jgi:hypothetical protein